MSGSGGGGGGGEGGGTGERSSCIKEDSFSQFCMTPNGTVLVRQWLIWASLILY